MWSWPRLCALYRRRLHLSTFQADGFHPFSSITDSGGTLSAATHFTTTYSPSLLIRQHIPHGQPRGIRAARSSPAWTGRSRRQPQPRADHRKGAGQGRFQNGLADGCAEQVAQWNGQHHSNSQLMTPMTMPSTMNTHATAPSRANRAHHANLACAFENIDRQRAINPSPPTMASKNAITSASRMIRLKLFSLLHLFLHQLDRANARAGLLQVSFERRGRFEFAPARRGDP